MPSAISRVVLIAAMSASLAACGARSNNLGQPGASSPISAASQPSAAPGGNASTGPSTVNIPTPAGEECGAYLSKPSQAQWIDEIRTSVGEGWDSRPEVHNVPRDQFVDMAVRNATDPYSGTSVSAASFFGPAPANGVVQFGKFLCSQADELEVARICD
jgi:hypothetical protein